MGVGGTLRSLPRRIRDSIGQEGPWSLALRTAASPMYRAGALLTSPLAFPSDELALMDVRDAMESDVETIVNLRPEYSGDAVRSRLLEGEACSLAFMERLLVACRWVNTGEARLAGLGLILPLSPDEIYVGEAYVHPAYRRRGINNRTRDAYEAQYRQRGYSSKVSCATLGRKPYGRGSPYSVAAIRTLRFGPFRKFWVRTYGPQADYWRGRLKELRWA